MGQAPRKKAVEPQADKARWAGNAPDRDELPTVKKRAILRTAATLFREHGYERTRLIDIAQALNVTKPTLYYYIKNKEDILVEIQKTGLDEIMEELIQIRRGTQSGAEILRRVIVRYANWVAGEFGLCVVRNFLITLAPESLSRIRRWRRTIQRKIHEAIRRGIDDGSLRPCEPWIVASAIVGAVNWMAFWYEARPNRRSAAELGDAYFNMIMEGIGAQDVSAGASPASASREPAAARKPATAEHRSVAKTRGAKTGNAS